MEVAWDSVVVMQVARTSAGSLAALSNRSCDQEATGECREDFVLSLADSPRAPESAQPARTDPAFARGAKKRARGLEPSTFVPTLHWRVIATLMFHRF